MKVQYYQKENKLAAKSALRNIALIIGIGFIALSLLYFANQYGYVISTFPFSNSLVIILLSLIGVISTLTKFFGKVNENKLKSSIALFEKIDLWLIIILSVQGLFVAGSAYTWSLSTLVPKSELLYYVVFLLTGINLFIVKLFNNCKNNANFC